MTKKLVRFQSQGSQQKQQVTVPLVTLHCMNIPPGPVPPPPSPRRDLLEEHPVVEGVGLAGAQGGLVGHHLLHPLQHRVQAQDPCASDRQNRPSEGGGGGAIPPSDRQNGRGGGGQDRLAAGVGPSQHTSPQTDRRRRLWTRDLNMSVPLLPCHFDASCMQ